MRGARAFIRAAPIVAIVLVLAGCAAPTPPPKRTATPTPTPTSAPKTAITPGSRVPVGCADLLGTSNVQALAGASAKVEQDERSAPTSLTEIAQQQYGAEDCIWDGNATGTDATPGAYLSVDVAPEATAEFGNQFTTLMSTTTSTPHSPATENVAGDESGFWCATDLDILGSDAPSLTCDAEMLVDDYWVSIGIGDVSGITRAQLTDGLTASLQHIASGLQAAGAPKTIAWRAPETTPPAFCSDPASTATVRAIVGAASLAVYPAGTRSIYASQIGLDGRDVLCYWTSPTAGSVDVELLAGGSWAIPEFKPVFGDSFVQSASPVTVPGASSSLLGCDSGFCAAFLAVGTTAVELDFDDLGAGKDIPALTAFAKAIAAT
jgi:hypothetical protein